MTNTENDGEFVPGDRDIDEPELARVGRVLLALKIDTKAARIRERAGRVTSRAFDGEDIRREDLSELRAGIHELEHTLDTFADPVVDDDVYPEVDDT